MNLTDAIDLEVQLYLDRQRDPVELHARDRGLDLEAGKDPDSAVSAWLAALRAKRADRSTGERVVAALRWARAVFVVVGLGAGWVLAAALLAFDGSRPINVLNYLAVAVLAQAAVLLLTGFGWLAVRRGPGLEALPVAGEIRAAARWVVTSLASRGRPALADAEGLAIPLARLRARRSLFRRQESAAIFQLLQLFGLALNLGLLARFFTLVTLTDLVFAWSTTLDLAAESLHGCVHALSVPFGWLFPSAVPSLELVSTTRFSRFDSTFVTAGDDAARAAGAWWRFLTAATVVYGLLPRLALWVGGRVAWNGALRAVRLDTPEIERVLHRLATPTVLSRGEGEESGDGRLPALPTQREGASPARRPTAVVRWNDLPLAERVLGGLLERLGLAGPVVACLDAGGPDYAVDDATLRTIPTVPTLGRIVVVCEAWETPNESLLHFAAALRRGVAPDLAIVIVLTGEIADGEPRRPAPDDADLWRRLLGTIADPWLDVVAVEGPDE